MLPDLLLLYTTYFLNAIKHMRASQVESLGYNLTSVRCRGDPSRADPNLGIWIVLLVVLACVCV